MDDESAAHSAQVARGAAWNMAGTAINKVLSFTYIIFIARIISQNDVGVFYLALGIISILTVWKDFGLASALIRYVPYYEERKEHEKAFSLLKNTLLITGLVGAALTLALWLSADLIAGIYQNEKLAEALRILCAFVLIDNLGRTLQSYVQGKADMKTIQVVGSIQAFAKLAITFLLVQAFGAGILAISLGYVLSYVISYPIFVFKIAKQGSQSSQKTEKQGASYSEMLREVAPFGFMLIILNMFYVLMSSTDKALLGYLLEPQAAAATVAIYSLAVSLANNLNIFPGTIGTIFLPVISKLIAREDFAKVRKQIAVAQRWMIFFTLPFAAVMAAFASEMLSAFFGSSYSSGGMAMSLFLVGMLLYIFCSSISLALAGMRLVKLELKAAASAAISNVFLNLLLIPTWGMEGAAAATAISLGIWAILIMRYGKEKIGFETPALAYKTLALGLLILPLAFMLKPSLEMAYRQLSFSGEYGPYLNKLGYFFLLGVASSICLSALTLLSAIFKCFEQEDVAVWKSLSKKAKIPIFIENLIEKVIWLGVEKK